jgi:hypothetical protein
LIWLWVATIELESKEILGISSISKERNMLQSEQFVSSLVNKIQDSWSSTSVSKDGGGTWYASTGL